MNRLLDVRKLYMRKYRKRLVVRTRKKLKFFEKLRTQATKMAKENRKNLQYGSGISGPFAEDSQRPTRRQKAAIKENSRAGLNGKTEYQCLHCGLWGHKRTSSKACLENKNNKIVDPVGNSDRGDVCEGAYALDFGSCQFYLVDDCRTT